MHSVPGYGILNNEHMSIKNVKLRWMIDWIDSARVAIKGKIL